jgi:CheY-like chemotaxis protein
VRVARDVASVVLTVRDEGAGITPAFLDTMFEPFAQDDTSLSRSRGGLGLGLAVVKGLVDLHGGRVSAASAGSGRGAELRVELPLHVTDGANAEAREPPAVRAEPCSNPAVLIFEDNADAAESLRTILSTTGYRVRVERTGRHAIEVVRGFAPAVVLCDLGLPDRDGYEIAAEIRSDRDLVRLPLIAISGYGSASDRARALGAGFDLHLTKPVPPALLLAELANRLGDPGRS